MRAFPARNKHIPYLRVYLRRTERFTADVTATATITATASAQDSFADRVILLLHFDTNNGPRGFYKDDSGYDHIIEYADPHVTTGTAAPKYGVSYFLQDVEYSTTLVLITSSMSLVPSNFLTGSYGILYNGDSEFHLGGGDFTLETHFMPRIDPEGSDYPATLTRYNYICGVYDGIPEYAWIIEDQKDTTLISSTSYDKWAMWLFYTYPADLSPLRSVARNFLVRTDASNSWIHAAIVKSGDKLIPFINGSLIGTQATFTFSSSLLESNSGGRFSIGAYTTNDLNPSTLSYTNFPCRLPLDDLRVTAAARYTQPFAPPTSAFPNITDFDTATGSTTVSYGYSFSGAYSAFAYDAKMQGISGGSAILYWWKMDSATFSSSTTNTFRNYGIAGPQWVLVSDLTLSTIPAIAGGTEDSKAQSQANWGFNATKWIYAPGINVEGPPFSIGGWFTKRGGVNQDYQRFFTTNVGGVADTQRGVDLRLMNSNRFRVSFGENKGTGFTDSLHYATDSSATFSLASGSAVFIVLTVSSANEYTAVGGIRPYMNLYVNGTEMSLSYGSGSITLAAFPVTANTFNGRTGIGFRVEDQEQRFDLDELFFHPRVLSAQTILDLYNEGNTLWPVTKYMSFTGFSAGPTIGSFSVSGGASGDPYFSNVILLAHFDGNYKDYSSYDASLSAVVDVSLGSITGQMGTGSLKLDTTSGRVIADNDSRYDLSLGPFTIETMVRFNNRNTNKSLIAFKGTTSNNGWELYVNTANRFQTSIYESSGSRQTMQSSSTYTSSVMYQVAWTRDSSYIHRLFVNGILQAKVSNTWSMVYSTGSRLTIGRTEQGSLGLVGYMDEVRITKGVCRYEADYTPSTDPFPNS